MTDPIDWRELEDAADLDRPRYDPERWGRCSICRRGPTDIVTFAGVQWSVCDLCATRWPSGIGLLSPPPDDFDDPDLPPAFEEDLLFETILDLATHYTDSPPALGIPSGAGSVAFTIRDRRFDDMRQTSPATLLLDPWESCPRFSGRSTDPLDVAPSHWDVLQGARCEDDPGVTLAQVLGGHIVAALDDRRPGLEHRIWAAARTNKRLGLTLCRPPFASPLYVIQDAVRRLGAYDDLAAAVRARRDALGKLLATLEARRGERESVAS